MAKYKTSSYPDFQMIVARIFGANSQIIYGNFPGKDINFIAWAQSFGSPHVVIFETIQGKPDGFENHYRDSNHEGVLHHPELLKVEF